LLFVFGKSELAEPNRCSERNAVLYWDECKSTLRISYAVNADTKNMTASTNVGVVTGAVKLVNGQRLLDLIFEPESKPSLRWLRYKTTDGTIPHVRIGHLVFYDT